MRNEVTLLCLGFIGLGCGSQVEDVSEPSPPTVPVTAVPRDAADPLPPHHPPVGSNVASRGPRRLSVEELERTWEAAAQLTPDSVQIPENMARSLGDADWLSVTEPSLIPSPLFMKFMVDVAAILCNQVLTADRQRPTENRVVLRYEDDADRNIRQLLLRFWAVDAPADDDPDIVRLRAAFEAARAGPGGELAGWLAVCIALTTSPEFLLY